MSSTEETIQSVVSEASNTYSDLSELVRNGTLTVRDYLRKLLNVSATSVSLAVVGLLGYAVYRSYKLHSRSTSPDFTDFTSHAFEPDPDIGRGKRPIEHIEEVNHYIFLINVLSIFLFLGHFRKMLNCSINRV